MTDAATMAAFGASDAACYKWPEDTAEAKACRAAFCEGAGWAADALAAKDAEIAKAVAAERERCAMILERSAKALIVGRSRTNQGDRHTADVLMKKAAKIRSAPTAGQGEA